MTFTDTALVPPARAAFSSWREAALLSLQALQVIFLAFHDWVPLGRLNDVSAVRRENTTPQLAAVTAIQTLPFTFGLLCSAIFSGAPYPGWLMNWLVCSYAILLLGQLRAWWVPYLLRVEPERARRYARMFGNTHVFLPWRNGIVPNTAHVLLHAATVLTLLVLLVR